MEWLIKHWWILVLVFLVGVIINVIKDLNRVDHKKFLNNKLIPSFILTQSIMTCQHPSRQQNRLKAGETAAARIRCAAPARSTTSRRNRKFAFIAVPPACNPAHRGYSISMISSPFGVLPLSASSK